jgi:hypothetical protein
MYTASGFDWARMSESGPGFDGEAVVGSGNIKISRSLECGPSRIANTKLT